MYYWVYVELVFGLTYLPNFTQCYKLNTSTSSSTIVIGYRMKLIYHTNNARVFIRKQRSIIVLFLGFSKANIFVIKERSLIFNYSRIISEHSRIFTWQQYSRRNINKKSSSKRFRRKKVCMWNSSMFCFISHLSVFEIKKLLISK